MSEHSEKAAQFARDTATHQMTPLHEDGLYRHLRFANPAADGHTPVGELASKVDRGAVRIFLGTGHYRDAMDAHRSEVLVEAADFIEAAQDRIEADEKEEHGSLDHETDLQSGAVRFMAGLLRAKANPAIRENATAAAATATPTDTNRRARLLNEISGGGRWKSGDVVAWYGTQGLTGLGANTARRDLAALRDSGAITQHDEKGVRFYTLATHTTRKDGRP